MAFDYRSVGFIGLGAMGKPMAGHLAEVLPKECTIWVYDILEYSLHEFCSKYAERSKKAASAKEVAENCEIILTMLPESAHVRDAYLDPRTGICASPSSLANKLIIDHSTIDTATSSLIAFHITSISPSTSFYDAPVSGGVNGAISGTLAIFLGCAPTDPQLPRLMSLLSTFAAQIIPCGAPTYGLAAKLSNNYLSGIIAIAASEAFTMGMKAGLDPRVLARVYAASTAQNAVVDRFCPVPGVWHEAPSSRGYRDGFGVELMRKDFALAGEMAQRVGAQNVLGEVGRAIYEEAERDEACSGLDSRVVLRLLGGDERWMNRPGDWEERG
ncbi:3-hydroxyisobutyrate dehydrogenase-like protein [Pseudovirgaria hyperparasitica]|uniref:3-hydroxyisobutyrate dehydrogenase n=1 Tax=Pseudovirgaria hyperparasitica TaxID=470096 RepID=A0A6A6WN40_9PEZI|nr:3-hydroxyisobutyrate dehydrogenase-like protein [Pseudovirgaria hyperparasitica]KAF2763528.1 3-hydroxyisobutyrate dehydrogenase-like protein [Pseudovirgaria hyperparasitica]